MLRPKDLAAKDYAVALKPTAGYEMQLHVSVQQAINPGEFQVVAANSGVYTANVSDTATLQANPMELLAVLQTDVNCGAADLVVTVTGTDQSSAALTSTATFKAPVYSQFQDRVFPKGYAVEVTPPADGKMFKTITNVTVTSAPDMEYGAGVAIALYGVPAVSTFKKVATKVSLDYTPKVPLPHAVQDGRDLSAWVKPGEIPEGSMELTSKSISLADGVSRINGRRVTGMIKEVKEDKIETSRIFFPGLVLTAKPTVGQSVEDVTFRAEGKYEDSGTVVAQ